MSSLPRRRTKHSSNKFQLYRVQRAKPPLHVASLYLFSSASFDWSAEGFSKFPAFEYDSIESYLPEFNSLIGEVVSRRVPEDEN